MNITVLTLFPDLFERGFLAESIMKRARERGAFDIQLRNFRDHGIGAHQRVDDTPYGGGPGMVLKPEPIFATMREVEAQEAEASRKVRRVMFCPQGRTLTQAICREYVEAESIVMLCGHYEGFDERIRLGFEWDEISLGDFVLTGGEIPAMAMIDAVVRLLPGVLGDAESAVDESFEGGVLEYPHYTRPPDFEGMTVPEILLSGHHKNIAEWRRAESLRRTHERRPDLLEEAGLEQEYEAETKNLKKKKIGAKRQK